jgi:hypothetical protein
VNRDSTSPCAFTSDEPDPWLRISNYIRSLISTLEPYPGMGRLIAGFADASSAARTRQRWVVRQLRLAGLSRATCLRAYDVLETYWLGSLQRQGLSQKLFSSALTGCWTVCGAGVRPDAVEETIHRSPLAALRVRKNDSSTGYLSARPSQSRTQSGHGDVCDRAFVE